MRSPGYAASLFQEDDILAARELFSASGAGMSGSGAHPLRLPIPADLRPPEGLEGVVLRVSNHSGAPVCVGLEYRGQGPGAPMRMSGAREELPPGGPFELFFPAECFGSYGRGQATAWETVAVFRREKDRTDPARIEVAVHGVRAVRRRPLRGPRLLPEGLAAALAGPPGRPLAAYCTKPFPGWLRDAQVLSIAQPVFPYPADTAADLLQGRIMGCVVGLPPDWEADPHGELEWRHFLHRHHFLRPLLRTVPLPARTLGLILEDWIRRNPVPVGSDGGAGPAWETLSAAWRLREWCFVAAAVWNHPDFGDDARQLLLRSIWEHARHLLDHRGHPGNWRLIEAAALTQAALLFPEFREAAHWTAIGLERLERELRLQFLPDGFHAERSPLYHALCVQVCLEVALSALESGVALSARDSGAAHMPWLKRRLPAWLRSLACLVRPDGTWPGLNDAGSADRDYAPLLRCADRMLNTRTARPVRTGRIFKDAGLAVLRLGQACALLKAGPKPRSHGHDDDLSLELSLAGRALLIDPGITRYAPSDRTTACRCAAAHSCALLPGLHARAGPIRRLRAPGLSLASARQQEGMVSLERSVGLLWPGLAFVLDEMCGPESLTCHVHWQFAPGPLALDSRTGAAEGTGFRLCCLPDQPPTGIWLREGQDGPAGGVVSLNGRDVAAPHLEYGFELEPPARIWWVIGTAATVRREGSGLRIRLESGHDVLLRSDPWTCEAIPPGRPSAEIPG